MKKTINNFITTERQDQMIQELMDEKGFSTKTMVFITALTEYYTRTFKYNTPPNTTTNPEEKYIAREVAKVKAKKAVEHEKLAEKRQICEMDWGGKVDGNDCVYNQYGWGEKTELRIPLKMINKEIAERNVFMQDIRVVANTFPEVKEKFKTLLESKE